MNQFKIYLPPPTNWQDFQSLVRDISASRYNSATVVEYGRTGQRQDGVDVYAEDVFGKKIGIQCKESKNDLKRSEITDEADKAMKFLPRLDLFIVATTAMRDAKLQAVVLELNAQRTYPFMIRVDFWDDLVDDINRYAMVLNDCYESYRAAFQQSDVSNHLACLRVAFDRPAFRDDFLLERNYNDFEEALVTTKRLFRTGFTMDRWSQIPVVQTVPLEFLPDGPYKKSVTKIESLLEKVYKAYLTDRDKIQKDWQYAHQCAEHYNTLRRTLLQELNKMLMKSNLPEIRFACQ